MQVLRFHKLKFGILGSSILAFLVPAVTVGAAQPARSARTAVALISGAPEVSPLQNCIATDVADSGPVVSAERLAEGLEFRIALHGAVDTPQLATITALLKPDLSTLTDPTTKTRKHNRLPPRASTNYFVSISVRAPGCGSASAK